MRTVVQLGCYHDRRWLAERCDRKTGPDTLRAHCNASMRTWVDISHIASAPETANAERACDVNYYLPNDI